MKRETLNTFFTVRTDWLYLVTMHSASMLNTITCYSYLVLILHLVVHVTFPSADLWYNRVDEDDWCVTRKPSLTYSQGSPVITLLFAFTITHRETKMGVDTMWT